MRKLAVPLAVVGVLVGAQSARAAPILFHPGSFDVPGVTLRGISHHDFGDYSELRDDFRNPRFNYWDFQSFFERFENIRFEWDHHPFDLDLGNHLGRFGRNVSWNHTTDPAPTPTPEPSTLLLLGGGIGFAAALRRKRAKT